VPTAALPIDDCLARLDLGEPWLRAVCWQNAASLFGLPGSGS
jgi:hypothetical protein